MDDILVKRGQVWKLVWLFLNLSVAILFLITCEKMSYNFDAFLMFNRKG